MKAEADRAGQVGAVRIGRNSVSAVARAEADMASRMRTKAEVATTGLMEAVVERGNLWLAYQRVVENKGAAGVDQLAVSELKGHLKRHWPTIRAGLLAGEYQPQPVRRVDIPKPQGGPLSPLLSNVLLTELDRELERRGHAFCRYADDCNIYVASERAGAGLLQSLTVFLGERLKLKVNQAKSAVARPWQRKYLGYSLTWHQRPKLRIAKPSLQRLTEKVRALLRGAHGRSLASTIQTLNPVLRGWAAYFKLAETKRALEERDGWIRHALRCILWRQWKRPYARARNLMKRGLTEERAWRSACNQRGPWWNAGASHMNAAFPKSWFDHLGLVSLLDTVQRLQRAS
jgi:hypothetical protein